MNTLNNIHALVDIDPEQAKVSIEEFSKLMRHVLYEGDQPTISLAKEMEYLRHYVSLMRLRYADTVRIDLSLPEEDGGAEIPPLVLASFVENAFKHGISYEKPSFVHVSVSVEDGKIVFRCSNSLQDSAQSEQNGVGLTNVRRRLDLLYGHRYTLSIDRSGDVYDIILLLPATVDPGKEGA
jgi:LytS/YehU family sensor histidine kinase